MKLKVAGKLEHAIEAGGLAALAIPSIQKLRNKPMDERKAAKVEVGGLAGLAAPSIYHLLKKGSANMSPFADELTEIFEKTAFSVTEKGHKYDVEKAEDRRRYYEQRTASLQKRKALAGAKNEVKIGPLLRYGFLEHDEHPLISARHQHHVATKHRAGKNAYNPLGGILTPTPSEKGGTPGFFGLLGTVKRKKASIEKTAGGFDRAAQMLRSAKGIASKAPAALKMPGSMIRGMPATGKAMHTVDRAALQPGKLSTTGVKLKAQGI